MLIKLNNLKENLNMSAKSNNMAKKNSIAKGGDGDEHYTQIYDIENEILNNYKTQEFFKGKVVLCPCDDPDTSKFSIFFQKYFNILRIKKLICTSYANGFQSSSNHGKKLVYDGITIIKNDLVGDGDFRSSEIIKLRDESDIIVTNPAFSVFKEFLFWILAGDKYFLIIGDQNKIEYKDIYPRFIKGEFWTGVNMVKNFVRPDGSINSLGSICWFTNLKHKRYDKPIVVLNPMVTNLKHSPRLRGKYSYDKYDNFNAIEVNYITDIPSDYDGIMGVPLSFIHIHCPKQFEILEEPKDIVKIYPDFINKNWTGHIDREYINGERKPFRLFIRKI